MTVPRNTAIIVKEEEDEKPRDPTCKTALENEIVSTITLSHEVWQETRFHEWYLPKEFSQGQLNGNRGSTACTVIAAEMCSKILLGQADVSFLSSASTQPRTEVLNNFVRVMRSGNSRYESVGGMPKLGLLGIDQVLNLFPDLLLEIKPRLDLGFFDRQHIQDRFSVFLKDLMKPSTMSSSSVEAAVFIRTPYSACMVFHKGRMGIFDSHSHGPNRGALIGIGSEHLTPYLAAEYVASYIERHYGLRSKATGCQVCFLQLSV